MGRRTSILPLSIVVAVDESGGFARENKIPWYYPEDMKHFRELTYGQPCVMGRRTYEELVDKYNEQQEKNKEKGKEIVPLEQAGSILKNRDCYVVTRNTKLKTPGATRVNSLTQAVQSLDENDNREIFVLGGFRLFVEGLSWATRVYMTVIKKNHQCDRFFPVQYVDKKFKIVDGEERKRVYFVTYERKQ